MLCENISNYLKVRQREILRTYHMQWHKDWRTRSNKYAVFVDNSFNMGWMDRNECSNWISQHARIFFSVDKQHQLQTFKKKKTFMSIALFSLRIEFALQSDLADYTLQSYHRFRWYATLENKTLAETFPKFPSVLRVIDRSDWNPPITATSVTF